MPSVQKIVFRLLVINLVARMLHVGLFVTVSMKKKKQP